MSLKSRLGFPYFELSSFGATPRLSKFAKDELEEYLYKCIAMLEDRLIHIKEKKEETQIKMNKYPEYVRMLPDIKKEINKLKVELEKLEVYNLNINEILNIIEDFIIKNNYEDLDLIESLPCFRY